MTVDYSKFAFTGIENPNAATLTEAITAAPVENGYVVVTLKTGGQREFIDTARSFAASLRAKAASTGLTDITAYREVTADEMGGAVPFDQAICAAMLNDAQRRQATDPEKWPTTKWAIKMMERNDFADWTLLVEFENAGQAAAAGAAWKKGDTDFAALTQGVASFTVGSFRNTMRYATVTRDPAVVHFFNFFPGPGDLDVLWGAWQEALPWFLEVGEFRSSFPLVALDPDQPILVMNYAHVDSLKHYFLGVAYDPNFFETVTRCYKDRGFTLPEPFFCKIVPV